MEVENLDKYDSYRDFRNCLVITVPGREGFLWIEPLGEIHNSGMEIEVHHADVQVLFNAKTGQMSAGWLKH